METLSDWVLRDGDGYPCLRPEQVREFVNKTLSELTSTAVKTKKSIADVFIKNFGDVLVGEGVA